jgi:hypothetical protein
LFVGCSEQCEVHLGRKYEHRNCENGALSSLTLLTAPYPGIETSSLAPSKGVTSSARYTYVVETAFAEEIRVQREPPLPGKFVEILHFCGRVSANQVAS